MSAPHPTFTRPLARPPAESLSAQLRRRTRAAHVSTEQAFDLEAGLADRENYAALLRRLRGFYPPVEGALHKVSGWAGLEPPIDLGARGRGALLDDDLRRLGREGVLGHRQMVAPELTSLADGLGWLYVVEGSSLGGQIVARRARAALGQELPVSFFDSEGRAPGRHWRELQHALDAFGASSGPMAVEQVVVAATDSFEQFGQWIGEGSG